MLLGQLPHMVTIFNYAFVFEDGNHPIESGCRPYLGVVCGNGRESLPKPDAKVLKRTHGRANIPMFVQW